MKVHYLEIVTTDVDLLCARYAQSHGVDFGEAEPELGGARTAKFSNGGMLGIRRPLRKTEAPIVRHYILVKDIQETVDTAVKFGAEVALPPTQLAGHGICAIVIQGGIETGFWQL